jgi:short-subunit dehydrogenase
MVSRNEEKLQSVKSKLKATFPSIKFEYIVSEASKPPEIEVFQGVLNGKNLRIIINNVGTVVPPNPINLQAADDLAQSIAINCTYPTLLTKALLPIIESLPGEKAILNISSITAYLSSPNLAVYSATKAYNLVFSRCLSVELSDKHIDVLAITPGFVQTQNVPVKNSSLSVPSAASCAKESLRKLGAPHWTITPNFFHSLYLHTVSCISNLMPSRILKYIVEHYVLKPIHMRNNERNPCVS